MFVFNPLWSSICENFIPVIMLQEASSSIVSVLQVPCDRLFSWSNCILADGCLEYGLFLYFRCPGVWCSNKNIKFIRYELSAE